MLSCLFDNFNPSEFNIKGRCANCGGDQPKALQIIPFTNLKVKINIVN